MQKKTKLKITAALLSAAFLTIGGIAENAYAYSDASVVASSVTNNGLFGPITILYQGKQCVLPANPTDAQIQATYSTLASEANSDLDVQFVKNSDGSLSVYYNKQNVTEQVSDAGNKFVIKDSSNSVATTDDSYMRVSANASDDTGSSVRSAMQSVSGSTGRSSSSRNSSSSALKSSSANISTASTLKSSSQSISTAANEAGTITATDSITAGGTITAGTTLTAASVSATTGTITGNQSVGGTLTVSGVSYLNGGASLNNQKITNLAAGTVSSTSTDAVNGAQLYAVQQLASNAKTYTAGSDISISSANAISVNKAGQVASGNTGIVTGGTVYNVTNKLQASINTQETAIKTQTSSISTLETNLASLKSSVSKINSNVASAVKSLNSGLSRYMDTGLANITDDGKATLKDYISQVISGSTTTNTASVANQSASLTANETASIAPASVVAEAPVANDVVPADVTPADEVVSAPVSNSPVVASNEVTSDDIDAIYTKLDTKVDKTDFNALKDTVASNTETIATNAENIKANATAIEDLKMTKADVDGSNIDVAKYSAKLGVGQVEKDNTGLVTGGTVFNALEQKADYDYVNAGFNSMRNQMESMQQQLSHEINKVGAGAAALAALHPQDYNPDNKLDFAVGYGHYKNANASALGIYYRPNAGTTFSLAGTIGNGDPMISAGVSFKLGMGKNVEKVMVSKAEFEAQQKENQAMKNQLNMNDEKIQQLETMLRSLLNKK